MAIFTDYVAAAIIYNLQILPESVLVGLVILAIVLANGPVTALAAGVAGTQLLGGTVGRLVMKYAPDSASVTSSMDACTQGYVGKSWDRLLRGTANPEQLWHPLAPSIFQATVGFLAGYGFSLNQIYSEEINAGVLSKSMMQTISIIAALLMILAVVFRVMSGCETVIGAVGGTAFGLILGYFGTVALAYATGRRATNIWGIPLLQDRINSGAPVYICQS